MSVRSLASTIIDRLFPRTVIAKEVNPDHIDFIKRQAASNLIMDHSVSPTLAEAIASWNGQLALLRGDNIYDVARLFFSSLGQHSSQLELKVDIAHGETQEESATKVSRVVEENILRPVGLRLVRTVMGRIIVSNNDILGAFVNPGSSATKATYDVLGLPEFCEWFKARFNEELVGEETPTLKRLRLDGQGNITSAVETIPAVAEIPNIMAFYPYFGQSPKEMIKAFMASKANILLLIGPPGTGKSNYILQMLRELGFGEKIHLADRDDVLTHPGFPDAVRDMPSGSVMVTEDSDKMVMKRTEGNATMSALLNATAGIVQRDSKLIISTNLPSTDKCDDALIRPGRCFKILEFKTLTREQANDLREMMGKPFFEFDKAKGITLAEALNAEDTVGENGRKQAFGFNAPRN